MEDGTNYYVQSSFAEGLELCDLPDALTIETTEQVKRIPALYLVESSALQWHNTIRISDCDTHSVSGG